MSEEINPGMQAPETVQPDVAEVKEEKTFVNYAEKTLAELTGLFQELLQDIDRLKKSKEAEAIKSAFYKKLSKEKAEAGVEGAVEEPSADEEVVEEAVAETPSEEPAAEPEEEAPAIELRPNKRDAKNKKSSKMLTPQQEALRTILLDVIGTHNAVLLDGDNQEIGKIQVKELAEYLNGPDSPAEIAAIASDGVIGQRLVDVAAQKNIPVLVGKKKGKITKLPSEITVWVKDDLD